MTAELWWAKAHDDGPLHAWPPGQDGVLWEAVCGVTAEPGQLLDGEGTCQLCRIMLGTDRPIHIPVDHWMS